MSTSSIRKTLAVFLLLFSASLAFSQGAMSAPQIALKTVNGQTTPLANATITVCAALTGGVPCSPALTNTIYRDIALTQPLTNPFSTDSSGNYQFAAAANTYTVTVTASGFNGYSYQLTIGGSSSGSSGITGQTPGQIPVANSATTLSSSIPKQGTDSSLLTSGVVGSIGSPLCVDANGGATTSGCSAIPIAYSAVLAGSNTAAKTEGTGGSLSPLNIGQVQGNQVVVPAGLSAPALTAANSGGTIINTHIVVASYTLVSAAGETPQSPITTATVNTLSAGACSGSACTVTITAPSVVGCGALPCGGYTGYTGYFCDTSGGAGCSSPVKVLACVNITTGCTITSASLNSGIAPPTINTAILQPANVQAGNNVKGSLPSAFTIKADGNAYPLWTLDTSNDPVLPSPKGTFMVLDRFFVTDSGQNIAESTQQGAGPIRNTLVSFSHLSGATTATGSTTIDDRVISVRGVDSVSSPTYEQWLGYYGEQFIYNNNFACNPVGSTWIGEDCVAAIRARANDQRTAGANSAQLAGIHGTASTNVASPKVGGAVPSVAGVVGTASQESVSSQNPNGAVYAGVVGSINASAGNSNGSGYSLFAVAPTTRFATANAGLFIASGFSNAADFGIRSDATSPSRLRGDLQTISLSPEAAGMVVNGTVTALGGMTGTQFATPAFSGSVTPIGTGGASTWSYRLYAKDASGGGVLSSTTQTTNVGIASMTAGVNFNRITIQSTNFCAVGAKTVDVYRTVAATSPSTTGKIGTFTITDCTAAFGTPQTFDDNALAGDGNAVPAANTSGGVSAAGYLTGTLNKKFVAADFTSAANTNFQTITGLSWTTPTGAANYVFHCSLFYSQATAAVADDFGIQIATVAPTQVGAKGRVDTSATAVASGVLTGLSTTTATSIVNFTPSASGTVFGADLDGTIELPAGENTINIMIKTSNSADLPTVKRDSYCYLQ